MFRSWSYVWCLNCLLSFCRGCGSSLLPCFQPVVQHLRSKHINPKFYLWILLTDQIMLFNPQFDLEKKILVQNLLWCALTFWIPFTLDLRKKAQWCKRENARRTLLTLMPWPYWCDCEKPNSAFAPKRLQIFAILHIDVFFDMANSHQNNHCDKAWLFLSFWGTKERNVLLKNICSEYGGGCSCAKGQIVPPTNTPVWTGHKVLAILWGSSNDLFALSHV